MLEDKSFRIAWNALKERMEAAGWTATEVQEQIKTVEKGINDLESDIDDLKSEIDDIGDFEFDEMNDVL